MISACSIFFIVLSIVCFCLKTEPRLRIPDLRIHTLHAHFHGGFNLSEFEAMHGIYSLEKAKTRAHPRFFYLELVANIWFTFEYIARLIFSPDAIKVRNKSCSID